MSPPTPDTQTLFLLQGLLQVAVALIAWTILAGRHDARAVALWCASGLLAGAGFALYGLRGSAPEWLGYPGATLCACGAYLLRGGVLALELRRPPRWLLLSIIVLAASAGLEACRAFGRDAFELGSAAVFAVAALWLAHLGIRLARREHNRSALLLGVVYLFAAAVWLLRCAAVAGNWNAGAGATPTFWDDALINLSALMVALCANLGYVGLVLERYRAREQQWLHELAANHAQRAQAELHTEALEALRAERRDTLNEAVPAMMHSIDAQGRLLAVSDSWLSKLGYLRSEVIGRPSTEFLTPASREHARQVVLPEFFRAGRCDNVSYQMVCKSGSLLDVLLSAVLVRNAGGAPLRSLAVIDDVTEKLAREAELASEHALREQVERHAEELDALVAERTEMLHVLAHEVRQPLNNAAAALRSARRVLPGADGGPASDRLRSAEAVMGEVLAGLDNTLACAALLIGNDRVETQDADIDTLLAIAIGDLRDEARTRITVQRMTPTRTAGMDTGLMRLALRNVLGNALNYSPPGSEVRLRVLDSDQPLALVLEVLDEGPGIEPTLKDRLFQRGQRGVQGEGQPGSGLGLYIVRRVMELHGGRVEALPLAQGGTLMRLWLPQGVAD